MLRNTQSHRIYNILISIYLIMLMGCGCYGYKINKIDYALDGKNGKEGKIVIGVKTYNPPIYSDSLIDALKETGLCLEVGHLDQLKNKLDYMAEVLKPVYGDSRIPILYIITLGIIPAYGSEEVGHYFSLKNVKNGDTKVIDGRMKASYVLGWAACFMNISPDWAMINPEKNVYYYDYLEQKVMESIKFE